MADEEMPVPGDEAGELDKTVHDMPTETDDVAMALGEDMESDDEDEDESGDDEDDDADDVA